MTLEKLLKCLVVEIDKPAQAVQGWGEERVGSGIEVRFCMLGYGRRNLGILGSGAAGLQVYGLGAWGSNFSRERKSSPHSFAFDSWRAILASIERALVPCDEGLGFWLLRFGV